MSSGFSFQLSWIHLTHWTCMLLVQCRLYNFDKPDGFSFSLEALCAHIDLSTSHDGPLWQIVCILSLVRGDMTAWCNSTLALHFQYKLSLKLAICLRAVIAGYCFDSLRNESALTDKLSGHQGPWSAPQWVYLESAYFCIWVWTSTGPVPVQASKKTGGMPLRLKKSYCLQSSCLTPAVMSLCRTSS